MNTVIDKEALAFKAANDSANIMDVRDQKSVHFYLLETARNAISSALILTVTFGTEFVEEIDETLDMFKKYRLVLDISKTEGIDCINYKIEFVDIEAAFLFGKTRPQLKLPA